MDNKKTVYAVPCRNYEIEEARKAINELIDKGDLLDFVKPSMTIAIKLNLVSAMKPEDAGTTHPALVRALCEKITSLGASVVLGDSPGGPFTAGYLKHVYDATGFSALSDMPNVSLNDDFSVKEVSNPEGVIAKNITVTNYLLEADAVINFCKLKTHGMMGMSAAIKNLFGTIPGTMKPEYHFRFPAAEDFSNMLIDLDEYWKAELNIVDAIEGMEGNGPTAGTPRPIGMVLASRTPYDLDVVGCKLIGMDINKVPFMVEAVNRKLTSGRMEDVDLVGSIDDYIVEDYKLLPGKSSLQFGGRGIFAPVIAKLGQLALSSRPKVKKAECIGCKKCFDICPAKAITMIDNKPVIDKNKCIKCFCCQEFCPKGAMKVKRTIIARLIQRT